MYLIPMKWNVPLCTYRLNWARRTSWGWWDDWDDTVLQTQDSKFEPWRSEAEHATSRSRRLPTILTFTRGWGRNIFCFFQTAETSYQWILARTEDVGLPTKSDSMLGQLRTNGQARHWNCIGWLYRVCWLLHCYAGDASHPGAGNTSQITRYIGPMLM